VCEPADIDPAVRATAATDRDRLTIELLMRGDPEGLRHLLEDHGGRVQAKLERVFGRALDASEIAEAMSLAAVRVWRSPSQLDHRDGTLRAWLFVIARNCALELLAERRRLALVPIDDFEELLQSLASTGTDPERLRRIADLHGCVRELPPLQRAVLLADLGADGLASAPGLAQQLATSKRAIYNARSNGRSELRRMMQRLGWFTGMRPADDTPAPAPSPHVEPEFG
jgi:DNA-directed RNA polymerase specialized sigma24 family protein